MKNFQFISKNAFSIFPHLVSTRTTNKSKEYRTLTDSLSEITKMFPDKKGQTRGLGFVASLLVHHIKKEMDVLKNSIDSALQNAHYKRHHDLLISYNRLENIYNTLHSQIRPYEYSMSHFDEVAGQEEILKTKAIIRVLSTNSLKAKHLLENKEVHAHDPLSFNSKTRKPFAELSDFVEVRYYDKGSFPPNGYALFVDKNLSPEYILNKVLPVYDRFEYTYLF